LKPGEVLAQLERSDLASISNALRSGRLSAPFSLAAVSRFTGSQAAQQVVGALQTIADRGQGSDALACSIDLLVEGLGTRARIEDLAQLVMTAPTESGAYHRDTRVVVTDLFRRAERSVVVAGYAVHQGKRIFEELATRMDLLSSLQVRLFLNLIVRPEDTSPSASIARFAQEFRTRHWPEKSRLPEVYFDRRALVFPLGPSIAFHAKCVILDDTQLFVSSANFTEAAQNRNVELGVLLNSPSLAKEAAVFLSELVNDRVCERAM
jgi:phosphatidylserine/phosphatidylglycerophosphate/cardiolipin synthase-like enzyme